MKKPKAVFNWSGGKDSALALQKILREGEYEVVSLLTTINSKDKRSSMHAIPLALLTRQANSLKIPLHVVDLVPDGNMQDYENSMRESVEYFKRKGVTHFVFGDIFLEDVRAYREKQLTPYGIKVVEPLWGKTTHEIMNDFLESHLKTIIVTTMADILDEGFIGKEINNELLEQLPDNCDICGENGEYHTFCFDGDIFENPVPFHLGEPVLKTFSIKMETNDMKDFSYWFSNIQ